VSRIHFQLLPHHDQREQPHCGSRFEPENQSQNGWHGLPAGGAGPLARRNSALVFSDEAGLFRSAASLVRRGRLPVGPARPDVGLSSA
jgi:hypothetical protein